MVLPPGEQRVAREVLFARPGLGLKDGGEVCAALLGEERLNRLGIAELAPPVGVAAGLDDVAALEAVVVAMLGVDEEGSPEGLELLGLGLGALLRLVLDDDEVVAPVAFEIPLVRAGE